MGSEFPDSMALPLPRTVSAPHEGARRVELREQVAAAFDQFREPLLRYLLTFRLPIPDGEEILQDVFLALFQQLDRGKRLDNLRGWLFRVAHNLALKRRDRTRRDGQTYGDVGTENLVIDPEPNPEDRMAASQVQRRLAAVVEALPEQDRRCLFLRSEGLRYREIAEILDISLGSVSLSLTRSLARIARAAERSGT